MNTTFLAEPATSFPSHFDAALDQLSLWHDAEGEALGRLFAQIDQRSACRALESLDQLHLDPEATEDDFREVLEEARVLLQIMMRALRAIPSRCRLQTAFGLPGPHTFEQHVCWSGARLEDVIKVLDQILGD